MQTINNILSYIFAPIPGRIFAYYWLLVALFILLVGGGLAIKIYSKKKKKTDKAFRKQFRSYPVKMFTLAAFFAIYGLARYNAVAFISMRFLLYVLLGFAIWLGYLMVQTYRISYPADKQRRAERKEKNRYIDASKKKK